MKKVAVFGKPGSGKSTVSKRLAAAIHIPLYQLDSMLYQANGEFVDRAAFDKAHQELRFSIGYDNAKHNFECSNIEEVSDEI